MSAILSPFARFQPSRLRRSIGMRVRAGFAVSALLAVASVSLLYNMDAGRNLGRVTVRDREVSGTFRELEVSVEQQSGAVQNFLLSGDERDLEQLKVGRARFSAALQRLESRQRAENGRDDLAAIRAQNQALDDLIQEEIALHRQGWPRSANYLWRTDGLATKDTLLTGIQGQVLKHNAAIDAEIEESRWHLRFSFAVSLVLVGLAALLAFAIGLAISRAVTRPVRNLMRVATAVRGGDLTARAPVRGDDELAVLSQTMNAMVEGLAISRARLKQALAETERSEERYRVLALNANDIIFVLDRQSRITFINPAAQTILGYAPEELAGRDVDTLLTDATRSLAKEQGGWVVSQPNRYSTVIELQAKDGRVVPVEVNSSVMLVNGRAVGIQGIARDMTERLRLERELRRLHVQDRRRVDQLTTLNQIGRRIAALQPVDTLLPQLVQMLGGTFGYTHVRILLLEDNGALETAASWDYQPDGAAAADDGPSALAMRALRGDAGFVAGSGRPEDDAATRSTEVAVPVRAKSGVLGVLDIRASADGGLDESDISTLQTLADQIAVAIENARLYEAGQQLAVSEERNRLARELHDSVTQELFSMTMIAGALPALMERKPDLAKERIARLHDLSRGALAEMRALLFALRPAALAEEGLIAAITKQAAAVESREGIKVHLDLAGDDHLPRPREEAFYRIFQEALNNIVKHARAQNVWITLAIGADASTLSVRDDGVGLAASVPAQLPTMGMTSMRERVEELGGSFRVESAPGRGTTIAVSVPAGAPEAGVALVPASRVG